LWLLLLLWLLVAVQSQALLVVVFVVVGGPSIGRGRSLMLLQQHIQRLQSLFVLEFVVRHLHFGRQRRYERELERCQVSYFLVRILRRRLMLARLLLWLWLRHVRHWRPRPLR
jgi:hypothetical protein